jgi:hypothetical protein
MDYVSSMGRREERGERREGEKRGKKRGRETWNSKQSFNSGIHISNSRGDPVDGL